MSSDDLKRFEFNANLEGRPVSELREFENTLTTASGCMQGEVCSNAGKPYDRQVIFLNGRLHVGCRDDLAEIAKWEGVEDPVIVPFNVIKPRINQVAAARERMEEERKQRVSLGQRYRNYLRKVHGVPEGEITDELVDRKLAEYESHKQGFTQLRAAGGRRL